MQQRIKEFGRYERYVWEVEFRSDEIDIPLGALINLTIPEHPEWEGGRQALVVGVEPVFTETTVLVEIMV